MSRQNLNVQLNLSTSIYKMRQPDQLQQNPDGSGELGVLCGIETFSDHEHDMLKYVLIKTPHTPEYAKHILRKLT